MTAPETAGQAADRASYVYLTRGAVAHTIEVTDSLMVDIDEDGRLVGVENLGDGDWRNALVSLAVNGKLRAAAAAPAGQAAPALLTAKQERQPSREVNLIADDERDQP